MPHLLLLLRLPLLMVVVGVEGTSSQQWRSRMT
jgi:hypothetical protein